MSHSGSKCSQMHSNLRLSLTQFSVHRPTTFDRMILSGQINN